MADGGLKDAKGIAASLERDWERVDLTTALQTNPSAYPLPLVYVLARRGGVLDENLDLAIAMLREGNKEHLMAAPREVMHVAHLLVRCLVERKLASCGVQPLKRLFSLLCSSNPHRLTPLHADIVQLCWSARCYEDALPLLEQPLYSVEKVKRQKIRKRASENDPKSDGGRGDSGDKSAKKRLVRGLSYKSILKYFFLGGQIYLELGQYEKALDFFQSVLTVPTRQHDEIQVRAYKKFVLVSLIVHGKLVSIPDRLACAALPLIRKNGSMYEELEPAFRAGAKKLEAAIVRRTRTYEMDGNGALVKKLCMAQLYWKIRLLTNTYSKLELDDIARRVGLDSADAAEDILVRMVSKGLIDATISAVDNVVTFASDDEWQAEKLAKHLSSKIHEVLDLNARVGSVNKRLTLAEYSNMNESMNPDRLDPGMLRADIDTQAAIAASLMHR